VCHKKSEHDPNEKFDRMKSKVRPFQKYNIIFLLGYRHSEVKIIYGTIFSSMGNLVLQLSRIPYVSFNHQSEAELTK